jgi:hypothetical protein
MPLVNTWSTSGDERTRFAKAGDLHLANHRIAVDADVQPEIAVALAEAARGAHLDVLQGADELSALEDLGGRSEVERRLDEMIKIVRGSLARTASTRWRARWTAPGSPGEP